MNKIEFVDLNRFIVSLGLALIAAGPALLWLFYREPLDLVHSVTELNSLTETARAIILERQARIQVLLRIIPWVSGSSVVAGIGLVAVGISRWIPFQRDYERMHSLQRQEQELKVRSMSPEEIVKKAADDVAVTAPSAVFSEGSSAGLNQAVGEYLEKEQIFLDALADALADNYEVLPHQRVGLNKYDAILKARDSRGPDYVIEFKDFSRGYRGQRLKEALSHIAESAGFAQFLGRPRQIPMVVAVVPADAPQSLSDAYELIERTAANPTPFGSVLIRLITPERLRNLKASDVRSLLDQSRRAMRLNGDAGVAG